MMKLGDIFRLMLGLLSTMSLGGMGFMLFMMDVPPDWVMPQLINIHFLGEFIMFFAGVMFVLTYWYPRYVNQESSRPYRGMEQGPPLPKLDDRK